jgi:2-(1,2-epoxy-1,2-dihydrophenyl)acetyl-CoA isomerase
MTEPLLCEIDGAIARVTLNRPEAFNAMDKGLRDGFKEAIARIHAARDVGVVILSGNGRGFSAGTDLKEGLVSPISMLLEQEYRPILAAISGSPKIWIAQVHGSAAGIGAAVAMNCDLMTMAEDATIYMAFAAIGLVPDGGNTWLLHRGLGYKRAMQAILEGRKFPAEDAVALGLANAAHPAEKLAEDRGRRTAGRCCRQAAFAPDGRHELRGVDQRRGPRADRSGRERRLPRSCASLYRETKTDLPGEMTHGPARPL